MTTQVVAVVQPMDMAEAGPALAQELSDYLAPQLSRVKMPRQIDFRAELPRELTGKLYKRLLRDAGIAVVPYTVVTARDWAGNRDAVRGAARALGHPLFVKPANLGSSVGVSKCNNRSDLMEGLMEAGRYDRRILIERGIDAREIEVSVLGNDHPQASVPGEILPSREFYSYEAKWIWDQSSNPLQIFDCPARVSPEIRGEIEFCGVGETALPPPQASITSTNTKNTG